MNQTTFKINTDIVSTTMNDKPLIFISEEAINLKRDNDNLKSIIKEVREKIRNVKVSYLGLRSSKTFITTLLLDILEILDKENNNEDN